MRDIKTCEGGIRGGDVRFGEVFVGSIRMILEHVTLRDFCLFRGEQTFDLAPLPATRNAGARGIVLFGGVNGAGKTTLLDAIQLALYGHAGALLEAGRAGVRRVPPEVDSPRCQRERRRGDLARLPVCLGR